MAQFMDDYHLFINKVEELGDKPAIKKKLEEIVDGNPVETLFVKASSYIDESKIHCYIKCQTAEDANRIFDHPERIEVEGKELVIKRNYAVGENEVTDSRLFLRIYPPFLKNRTYCENLLMDYFGRENLRERIRIEDIMQFYRKAILIFKNREDAVKALKKHKEREKTYFKPFYHKASQYEKYKIGLQVEFDSDKTLILYNVKKEVPVEELLPYFKNFSDYQLKVYPKTNNVKFFYWSK